jgi:hypothetical protein
LSLLTLPRLLRFWLMLLGRRRLTLLGLGCLRLPRLPYIMAGDGRMIKVGFALILAGLGAILAFFLGSRIRSSDVAQEIRAARSDSRRKNEQAVKAIGAAVAAARSDAEQVVDRDELAKMLDE